MKQSAGGDEEAFAAVYDATAARAYGLGLSVLRDPAQAREGCSHSAAERVSGPPVGTVHRQIRDGLLKLHDVMDGR